MEFRRSRFGGDRNIEHKDLRICDMRNRESTLHIKPWSQPLVMRREGVSPDKRHFEVSEIATCSVKTLGHRNDEMSKSVLKRQE
jgi:hypothetical protein